MKRQEVFHGGMPPVNAGRRLFVCGAAAAVLLAPAGLASAAGGTPITMWKNPNCGCCRSWVAYLERNGFSATVVEAASMQAIKEQHGVPPELHSCHTAEVGGYAIEGHVPEAAIRRLLAQRPAGRGLAVPGMPIGSPGMEGGTPEVYTVWLFGDGTPRPFGRFLGDRTV